MHTLSTPVEEGLPATGQQRLPTAAGTWQRPNTLSRDAGWRAVSDGACAIAAIVAVLLSQNLSAMPTGVDGFLSARVSIKNVLLLAFLASAWPMVLRVFGLYDEQRLRRPLDSALRVAAAATAGTLVAAVFPLTSGTRSINLGDLPVFWIVLLTLTLAARGAWWVAARLQHGTPRRVLIVGSGPLARRVFDGVRGEGPGTVEVVGFIDENGDADGDFERVPGELLGRLGDLEPLLMREVIDEVVVALPVKSRYQQIQQVLAVCERAGVHAKYGTHLFAATVASPRLDAHSAFVGMHVTPDGAALRVKRVLDVVLSAAALVVLSPLMLVIAAAIKLSSPGPAIYPQQRCGLNKRPLRMYKFRSMTVGADELQSTLEARNEADGPVFKIRNDPRITSLGRILRRSSLDELPQLWNVLRGDMSLVGPRPLPWRDVHRITRPADMRRFSMRPGLTCLWQVQGRCTLDFSRWVELDLEYIDTWSLGLDAIILLKTVPAVLSAHGAN